MEGILKTLDEKAIASRIRDAIIKGAPNEIKVLKKRALHRAVHMHWIRLLKNIPGDCDEAVLSVMLKWVVENDLFKSFGPQDQIIHVESNQKKIRTAIEKVLPDELLNRFDKIIEDIHDKLYPNYPEENQPKTPKASNVSASCADRKPKHLAGVEARWLCLQLAQIFSSQCGNDDTVADLVSDPVVATLAEKFGKVMEGMLPFLAVLDHYDIVFERKKLMYGGFGLFTIATKKESAPSHFAERIGIKLFRTDVYQSMASIANETLLMKEACDNRLFPTVYSLSIDPVLPFVVTAVVEGGSLKDFVDSVSDLQSRLDIIPGLLKNVSGALILLGNKNIAHRDVKPDK